MSPREASSTSDQLRCHGCGNPLPPPRRPGRVRKWCDDRCRKQACTPDAASSAARQPTDQQAAARARRDTASWSSGSGPRARQSARSASSSAGAPPRFAAVSQSSATALPHRGAVTSAGLFAKPGNTREEWARARHRGAHETRALEGQSRAADHKPLTSALRLSQSLAPTNNPNPPGSREHKTLIYLVKAASASPRPTG
jgi:hypothetical protein